MLSGCMYAEKIPEKHPRYKHWNNEIIAANRESNPVLHLMFPSPHSLLEWLPCFIPALLEAHTHFQHHTAQSDSRVPVVRHGGAGAHSQQLTWSSLDGVLQCAGWRTCGLKALLYTDWIPQQSVFTMEFGRVWSRYQRTLLITMMMFKLGKASTCAL